MSETKVSKARKLSTEDLLNLPLDDLLTYLEANTKVGVQNETIKDVYFIKHLENVRTLFRRMNSQGKVMPFSQRRIERIDILIGPETKVSELN